MGDFPLAAIGTVVIGLRTAGQARPMRGRATQRFAFIGEST
jgi:hypothetical protein